jgi:Putative bacterial sensory transduction regulator
MSVSTETQRRWFATYVQSLMTAILDEPAEPDDEGDIPIQGTTAQCWVRADAREPWGVQIFAIAAHSVPVRAATLREINEMNATHTAIKVALHEPGSVMVDYRLMADAVTEDNLREAVSRVLMVADQIGPLLTAVYGGSTPIPLQSAPSDL